MNRDKLIARVRELEDESGGRLRALNEKAEEARREWQRAEHMEAENRLLADALEEMLKVEVADPGHVSTLSAQRNARRLLRGRLP